MKKTILIAIVLLVVGGAVVAWFVWNKPHRDVAEENALPITAEQLFAEFQADEGQATAMYADKALLVTGKVAEVNTNQEGKTVVILKTPDDMYGINCTFKEKPPMVQEGSTIKFKGICRGMVSDVIVNDGILVKD